MTTRGVMPRPWVMLARPAPSVVTDVAAARRQPCQERQGASRRALCDRPVLLVQGGAWQAKVPGTLHRLRHTFCEHLAMAGVPLQRIQLLAGHADYKTTEIYAHLSPTGCKGAVNKLKF